MNNLAKNVLLVDQENSTVIAEFKTSLKTSSSFQSEADLENEFIKQLVSQGYEYLPINNYNDLMSNLKKQIEELNNYKFSNEEWKDFLNNYLLKANENEEGRSLKFHKNHIYPLQINSNGFVSTKNIMIIDKNNIHNNKLQVINQYEYFNYQTNKNNRYDVTILVNGLPLVHIELKKRGENLKEAFNQIERYKKDSFSNLFLYTQLFVISNGTKTKYYSNTTRYSSINEKNDVNNKSIKTSNSFKFTSYWSDAKNNLICDLMDFCATFFSKNTILNILTKYCVLTSDNTLLVLRPYQIVATERIINKIRTSVANKKILGTTNAGGFIWHTTGSGKTLTSFRTATLAKEIQGVDKVLFVVDRKDLDYQTIKEYERYSQGCVSSNATSNILAKQIESNDDKIIITTIQRLGLFIAKNRRSSAYNSNVVIIFDECHRSQFGELHRKITHAFKNYMIFGFTGTPIMEENSIKRVESSKAILTTKTLFGDCLHSYTIDKAIRDNNVLCFKTEFYKTADSKDLKDNVLAKYINKKEALENPIRIGKIVHWLLDDDFYNYNRLTRRNNSLYYSSEIKTKNGIITKVKKSFNGFNSILACSSIDSAKIYYTEFKKQQEKLPENQRLKIGLIYSYSPNESDNSDNAGMYQLIDDENNENTNSLDKVSRDFLDEAINDYNKMFNTTYSTSSENFNNYYKDFSMRLKNRELDIAIVVNMFLTGFDSATLNTLWIDKKIRHHSLIQAMSRTNRILNDVKDHGNIVFFINLEDELNEAIKLFTDENNIDSRITILRPFKDYFYGYYDEKNKYVQGFKELVDILRKKFPDKCLTGYETKEEEKEFITTFGKILSYNNLLSQFAEFKGNELITGTELQDYKSSYIELNEKYRNKRKSETDSILFDIEFKIELIKSVEVNIDYILNFIDKHKEKDITKEIYDVIYKDILASPTLRKKKDLIDEFIASINDSKDPNEINTFEAWNIFIKDKQKAELQNIIKTKNLKSDETIKFMNKCFKDNEFNELGESIPKLLNMRKSFLDKNRYDNKTDVIETLKNHFNKFHIF